MTVLARPARQALGRARRAPWFLWLLPLVVLAVVLVPLGHLLWRALTASEAAQQVLLSRRTLGLLANTSLLTAAVTISATALGVATAWLTVRTDLAGRRTWATLCSLPLVIPSFVGGFVLISALGPRGLLADLLAPLGVERIPSLAGFPGAWLALSLFTYPYVHLVVAAALRSLDPAQEEAARALGASPRRAFRTVVLPQLRPAATAGALLVALYTLSDFGAVSLMRFDAFTRVIYAQYQGRLDRTPAAVLALLLVLMALAILWVESHTRGRATYHGRRPPRPAMPVHLDGRARWTALTFLAGLVFLALALPVGVLGFWLVRGVVNGEPLRLVWRAAGGSLGVSLAAGVAAMVVAAPAAMLVVRYRSRASGLLERSFYVVYALPHITVGLALVFFAANYVPVLYQSFFLLAVAYVALFLPQATGAGRAALLQVSPHLEEAARSLGKSPLGTIATVTAPLMGRGLVAGGALVFLTSMKELPATLLLRPTGFDTLAVRVWSAANDAFFARAAAPALLLLAVSAVPMYLLISRGYAAES